VVSSNHIYFNLNLLFPGVPFRFLAGGEVAVRNTWGAPRGRGEGNAADFFLVCRFRGGRHFSFLTVFNLFLTKQEGRPPTGYILKSKKFLQKVLTAPTKIRRQRKKQRKSKELHKELQPCVHRLFETFFSSRDNQRKLFFESPSN
jgi:hypothetical protein